MNLLVVAHDTGAANALSPVIGELRRRGMTVGVLASGAAEVVFRRNAISFQSIAYPPRPQAASEEALRSLVRQFEPRGVLLGTGWRDTLDKAILRLAKEQGIASCSFVDSWMYFTERFWDAQTQSLILPTRMAVVDENAAQQAQAAGIPYDKLVAVGQPYLEALAQQIRRPELLRQAEQLRHTWLAGSGHAHERIILFASESYAQFWGPQTSYYRGYTEEDVLEGLAVAAEQCEQVTGISLSLVVKPHPCQIGAPLHLGAGAIRRGVRVLAQEPLWPCLLAADAVVGMTSMALIEASIAGRPTVSFQPNWKGAHPFAGTPFVLVSTLTTVGELSQWLTAIVCASPDAQNTVLTERLDPLLRGEAASRLADLTLEIAHRGQPVESYP